MPNGYDRNWIRFCAAVDGFRMRYGRWPDRVRMPAGGIAYLFRERDLLTITAKVRFVLDIYGRRDPFRAGFCPIPENGIG